MSGQKPASGARPTASFRTRMLALAAAIVAMLAAIAVLAKYTWEQSTITRGQVRHVHEVGVWVGHQIREAVHALDTRMLRFKLGADPDEWRQFMGELQRFRGWLDEQRSYLSSTDEITLLAQLHVELTAYETAAGLFAQPSSSETPGADVAIQVAELSRQSKTLISLGFELASAHQATADRVLAAANHEQVQVHLSTLTALGMILVVGTGMGWIVYRDSIAPLRRSLLESRLQLARSEKLASLGELSAAIAHEIRNPLTAVKARLFTLQKRTLHDDGAAKDARVIASQIDRLERIVHNVLRFSRPPNPIVVDVEPVALLRHVADLLGPQWASFGVRFVLAEGAAPDVRADPDLIQQALLNLAQNAAQSISTAGRRGTVELRARFAPHFADGQRRASVRLEVSDDGPGVPPEIEHRLFDPFFTTKASGTGLGLALTARIIEAHGGRVEFSSSPEDGTTFALVLPAALP